MKLLTLIAATLLASTAFAAEPVELMHVTKGVGFAPPQHRFHVDCKVGSANTIVVTNHGEKPQQQAYNPTKYTAKVRNAAAAVALFKKAAKGKIVETEAPTDGPGYSYTGIIEGDVVDSHVKLYHTGRNYEKNNAKGVDDLIEFADENCPVPGSND